MSLLDELATTSFLTLYRALPRSFALTEIIDVDGLQRIIDHPITQNIQHYVDLQSRLRGQVHVVRYVRGEYSRYQSEGMCLAKMPRNIRSECAQSTQKDVDAKSCFARLLRYLCDIHDYKTDSYRHLDKYIEDRMIYIDSLQLTDDDLVKYNSINYDAQLTSIEELGKKVFTALMHGAGDKCFEKNMGLISPIKKDSLAFKLKEEWQTLAHMITSQEEYDEVVKYSKNKKAAGYHEGCSLACILQTFETLVTIRLMRMARSLGLQVTTYEFDGVNIMGDEKAIEILLMQAESQLPLTYKIKERPEKFTDKFPVVESADSKTDTTTMDKPTVPTKDNFAVIAAEFEKTNCKVIDGAVYVEYTPYGNIMRGETLLKQAYRHKGYTDKAGELCEFIPRWISHKHSIKLYDTMDVYPPPFQCPDNIYNLWRPYPYSGEPPEDYKYSTAAVDEFKGLVSLMANHNEKTIVQLTLALAHILQRPAQKLGVAIVIKGRGGDGKSVFASELIKRLVGTCKHVVTETPNRDVWGTFNSLMGTATVVIINELQGKAKCNIDMAQLNALLTDSTLVIYPKGKDGHAIKSYHNVFILSNDVEPIPINDRAGTRRFCQMWVSGEKFGKKKYWTDLCNHMDDPSWMRSVYDYLQTIELPQLAALREMLTTPVSEHQGKMLEDAETMPHMWLRHYVQNIKNANGTEPIPVLTHRMSGEMFNGFFEWAQENRMEHYYDCRTFGKALRQLETCYPTCINSSRIARGIQYAFKIDDLIRLMDESMPSESPTAEEEPKIDFQLRFKPTTSEPPVCIECIE